MKSLFDKDAARTKFLISNPQYGIKSDIKFSQSEYRKNNKIKIRARKIVFCALRSGDLKKGICHCGNRKVEAHHSDYSKPLSVIWLCKKHHTMIHRGE